MSALIQPSSTSRSVRKRPMARPSATPRSAAGTKPLRSEPKLEPAERRSVPSVRRPHHATATLEALGTNMVS